jgi:hypothetical protein
MHGPCNDPPCQTPFDVPLEAFSRVHVEPAKPAEPTRQGVVVGLQELVHVSVPERGVHADDKKVGDVHGRHGAVNGLHVQDAAGIVLSERRNKRLIDDVISAILFMYVIRCQ